MATLFFRKKTVGFNSIEQLFNTIIPYLPNINVVEVPKKGISLKNIIINILFAKHHKSSVNHIVGDINYIVLGLKRKHTILTIHDIESLLQGSYMKKKVLFFFWVWWPIRKVRFVTVISETTKLKLLSMVNLDKDKVRVIHNCVSPAFVYSPKVFYSDYPTILHIGTKSNKNLERTIEALKDIPCKLHILGKLTEDQTNLLLKHSIDYESFFQIPFDQVIELYKKCDLLTFISLYEGFGLPIIEAQAIGRPVITSNISAMPEIAEDSALLVDPYQVEEIRKAILLIISDKEIREDMVKKGLKNVERFRTEIIAEQYTKLYNEVINES